MAEQSEAAWVRAARRAATSNRLRAEAADADEGERRGGQPGPDDDFWYGPVGDQWFGPGMFWYGAAGGSTASGVRVTSLAALRQSVVFGCVRVVSETLMTIPMELYRKAPGSKKREVVTSHAMLETLQRPNDRQLGPELLEVLTGHMLLRGTAFARLVRGPRTGFADEIRPLLPERLTVERTVKDQLVYRYTELDGSISTLDEAEVLRVPGFGGDGVLGYSVVTLARESIGLALAEEGYGARLFSQAALHAGVLSHPGKLSTEAQLRLRASWMKNNAGLRNAHKPAVLEEGMKWQPVSMTAEDAQFLESRSFQAYEICRWFRVPPHLLGILDRSTNNNIEQQALEFVKYTMKPVAARWALAIKRDLLEDPDLFVRFNFDDLAAGDLESWMKAHSLGVLNGIELPNEAREARGMDPVDGGDQMRVPLNTGSPGGSPDVTSKPPAKGGAPDDDEASAAPPRPPRALALEAARRVVHREVAEIQRWAPRLAGDPAAWRKWLDEFYARHEEVVRSAMLLGDGEAKAYCLVQRRLAENLATSGIEAWEVHKAAILAALSMAEEARLPEPKGPPAPKRIRFERDGEGRILGALVVTDPKGNGHPVPVTP